MRKQLIQIILFLTMVSSVVGLAKVDFTFKQSHNNTVIDSNCYGTEDKIWCFVDMGIYTYVPDTNLFQKVNEFGLSSIFHGYSTQGYAWDCFYDKEKNRFLCMNKQGSPPDEAYVVAYNIDTNTTEDLTFSAYGQSDFFKFTINRCQARPVPDDNEIYCWGASSSDVRRFDLNTNVSTTMLTAKYPENEDVIGNMCSFRNNNEFWCFGGFSPNTFVYYPHYMRYIISTNTSIVGNLSGRLAFGQCRWFDDVAYCYGFSNVDGDPFASRDIIYFDPNTDTTGLLYYQLGTPYLWTSSYGSASAVLNTNKDFIMGGFIAPDFNNSYDIWEVKFSPCNEHWVETNISCTGNPAIYNYQDTEHCLTFDHLPARNGTVCTHGYQPEHNSNDITGLFIDIPVEVGINILPFAGLIAIVGLFGVMMVMI